MGNNMEVAKWELEFFQSIWPERGFAQTSLPIADSRNPASLIRGCPIQQLGLGVLLSNNGVPHATVGQYVKMMFGSGIGLEKVQIRELILFGISEGQAFF